MTGQATVTVRNPTNDWLLIQPILLTDMTSSVDIKKIVDSLRPQYPWIKRDLREYHRNFMIGKEFRILRVLLYVGNLA